MAEAGEVTAGDLDDPATVVYIAVMISMAALSLTEQVLLERPGGIDG